MKTINEQIAKRLGWKKTTKLICGEFGNYEALRWVGPNLDFCEAPPDWENDLNEAVKLVQGYMWTLTELPDEGSEDGKYNCELYRSNNITETRFSNGTDDKPARAICLAWLKMMEVGK